MLTSYSGEILFSHTYASFFWRWQVIARYFPLFRCLEGLKMLVESLFGATFHRIPISPQESWHPDVMKLSLHHPQEVTYIFVLLTSIWSLSSYW
jgi:Zn-dependent oligopeptidase